MENLATGGSSLAGFYRDSENLVHLKGAITNGGDGSTAFRLPERYRPRESLVLPVGAIGGGVVIVTANGNVAIQCVCDTSVRAFGLDGLTFRVGPGSAPSPSGRSDESAPRRTSDPRDGLRGVPSLAFLAESLR